MTNPTKANTILNIPAFLIAFLSTFSAILTWGIVAFQTGFVYYWPLTTLVIGAIIYAVIMFVIVKYSERLSGKVTSE